MASDRTVIPFSELKSLEPMAEGGFGIVHKGVHAVWGSVAYKQLKITVLQDEQRVSKDLLREAQQGILHHPNIIRLLGVIFEPGNFGCVFEFAKYGGLDSFVNKNKVDWALKLSICCGVSLGMNYLHSVSPPIIHGDLKLQNVLIGEDFVAKICDFGLTKWKQISTEYTRCHSQRGTVTHIPPENWKSVALRRTVKYDVYGFGMMLWELFTEKRPFETVPSEQIRLAVIDGQRPDIDDVDDLPRPMLTFIRDMLEKSWAQDPSKRPTFADISTSFKNYLKRYEDTVIDSKRNLLALMDEKRTAKAPENNKSLVKRTRKPDLAAQAPAEKHTDSKIPTQTSTANEQLRTQFKKLHRELIEVNLSTIIDQLFAVDVISATDMHELHRIKNQTEKSQQLLSLLHTCGHPQAFVELRRAIENEPNCSWLVSRLDSRNTSVDSGVKPSQSAKVENRIERAIKDDGFSEEKEVTKSEGSKQELMNKYQQICNLIIDYLVIRETISSYQAAELRRMKSHKSRLNRILATVHEYNLSEELQSDLLTEPSCSWFVEYLYSE